MFKIVQTIERGEPQLSVVPHKWEKIRKLYWPKMKADKLITEGDSAPGNNWLEMECTLKRKNLSLQDAEKELEIMMSCTDTDEMTMINPAISSQQRKPRVLLPKRTNNNSTQYFNEIARALVNVDSSGSTGVTNISQLRRTPVEPKQVIPLEPTILTIQSDNEIVTSEGIPEADTFELNIPFLDVEKYEKVLKNQEEILKNQRLILKQLASQSVQLDECLKHRKNSAVILNSNMNNDEFSFNIIETAEDLSTFEKKLGNEEYLQIFIKKISVICGTTGRENGINVCYALVDKFFSRKFMPKCSWAGGSRGENKKVPFETHTNIINTFFKLVHAADTTFTLDACEQFFKNILKNSTKRSHILGSRSSKFKRRPKHLVYKSHQEVEQHIVADKLTAENKTNANVEVESHTHSDDESDSQTLAESEDDSEGSGINMPKEIV